MMFAVVITVIVAAMTAVIVSPLIALACQFSPEDAGWRGRVARVAAYVETCAASYTAAKIGYQENGPEDAN